VELDRANGKALKLFTPGPVDISPAASEGLARPLIHHRTDRFREVMDRFQANLKTAFQTCDGVVTLASSGTGGMEALVANLFSAGERVFVPVGGKFSNRWVEICEAYGVSVHRSELPPGGSPAPELAARALREDEEVCAVLLTHCETSTGSLTDVRGISKAVRDLERSGGRRVLICVDCVTSLCIDELLKDVWGIDCAVGASQKGLLSPPGLSFLSVGPRAIERMMMPRSPRYYFDLRKYLEDHRDAPFTPSVSLVRAAAESLDHILELGLENVWRANRSAASALRLLGEAAGLRPLARHQASAVVAFWTDELDAGGIRRTLESEHGMVIAGGQGPLAGKIIRISALGKGPAGIMEFARAFARTMAQLGRYCHVDEIAGDLERILEDCKIWE
jgi:aspartate aminotransferase-like enzyme